MNQIFKKHKKYFSITLVCLLMGVLISLSVKTYLVLRKVPTDTKNQTLIEVIDKLEADTTELEKNVDNMRSLITTVGKENGTDLENLERLKEELDKVKLLAEQTEVAGPGITVSLDDNSAGAEAAKVSDPKNYFPENFIIHDTDLRYLLNDVSYLADAISINGQRLVSMSDVRCVGTVIMVNSTRLAPPYEISLIGSPVMLEAALLDSQQYSYLKNKNMPIKVTKSEKLILPAYTGTLLPTYAQPDKESQNPKGEAN